jgi:5-formyltetrahydrofolate cyclo-ligase
MRGAIREKIWKEMEEKKIAIFPLPCRGRIPNFKESNRAASKLREIEEYKNSKIIFVNPDAAQFHVRKRALIDGKKVVMATPKLEHGFIILDPNKLKGKEREASSIKGAFKYGEVVNELPEVDLAVEGCVAVDLKGNRLGKGGGYGDREIKMVRERNEKAIVTTTCHSIQVIKEIPVEEWDEKIDIIVTEKEIYYP